MKRKAQAGAGLGRSEWTGRRPVFLKGLSIGLGVMAIQLGLLLDSFELYVQGKGGRNWQLATAGGLLLFGSLLVLWVLHGPPRELDRRLPSRMPFAPYKSASSPRRAA